MSINKYKVFKKVVELGSLTKAAEALGFTQSGVSHLINSLEDDVGFLLLSRNRSGVKLTENGEMILKTVSEILKWNEHLEQQVAAIHGIELGTIHIGTFTSVSVNWLPGIIKDFQHDYPNISVNFIEGDYREIEDWIADGKIDCGFLSLPTRDAFDVIPLAKDQMLVLLPIDHPLSTKSVLSLADIMEEPFIMQRKGGDDDINRVIEGTPFKPKIKYTVADDYAIMAMVEKGLGISILPELVLRGQQRKIRLIGLKEPKYRSLGIAVNSMKHVSPATKRFLDYVQKYPELKV
ncbi:LysR family transcriptional regulator [Schinkia azotoformans]|uniref:LysR family transcriptional regulator n=1 Tax=Schinkia azotoformans LMG 9581 TaxID=1131731 RepID=K6D6X2_SCHAZ|nr:LysR family transcriptional regulator [Schinkia azotoformans]EKN68272.1 LysR family transcriptional regulator [Schinkia azotoformans LMG 9581]MEC1638614.1 LysR family transcriptional regulator [Schinkia azotoformans]MEC1945951.1 LysR family transcriptional regulator [Schinkia azotoformans]